MLTLTAHAHIPTFTCIALQSGIASLAWGASGYALLLAEAPAAAAPQLLELAFAHALAGAHRVHHFGGGSADAAPPSLLGINREAHLLLVRAWLGHPFVSDWSNLYAVLQMPACSFPRPADLLRCSVQGHECRSRLAILWSEHALLAR